MSVKTSDWRPGPTVCRCCLSEGCYKDISTEYFWMGKREVYAEMLLDTLNVTIAYSKSGPNSNSRLICEPCISRLRDAHDFKRQVLECEKTFMQHLDPGSSSVQKELEMTFEEVKVERVKKEKKLSDDEDMDDRVDFLVNDDSDDDLDDEPLMKLATKVPKKENSDLLDLLDNTQITVKRKSTPSTSKAKEPPAKKAKKREITIKPTASKATASKAVDKKKKGTISQKSASHSVHNGPGHVQQNAAIMLECSNICPFVSFYNTLGCAHCSYKSTDFDTIKRHTETHVLKTAYLKKNPRNSVSKVEVSNLKCVLCQKSMKDISQLFVHLIEIHNKPLDRKLGPGIVPYLLNDRLTCADCGLNFDLLHNLNIHVNEHYPNFVCFKCGLSFMAKQQLKNHERRKHSKIPKKFYCPKCFEEFSSNHKKHIHLASVHNIFRYNCPHCPEKFCSYSARVTHLGEFHGKVNEYPCKMCSKIFSTNGKRTRHVQSAHVKNKKFECCLCGFVSVRADQLKEHMVTHSDEKKYQCNVCKKSFKRKNTLLLHMRIHNNDRRFVCGQCDKAFVQKCTLQKHMKSHKLTQEARVEGKVRKVKARHG